MTYQPFRLVLFEIKIAKYYYGVSKYFLLALILEITTSTQKK